MADEDWWLLLGFGGQAVFMGRFVIQWLATVAESHLLGWRKEVKVR